MIRVAHSVGSLAPRSGGPARTVTALTDNLTTLGACEVVLLSQRRPGDGIVAAAAASRVERRIAEARADVALITGLPFKRMLRTVIGERPPVLLHDHGVWMPYNHHVATTARHRGIPLVIHPRGMLESWALNYHRWRKRAALRLYQYRDLQTASLLFATAEMEAQSIRRLGLRQPIAVIPNGVEMTVGDRHRVRERAPRDMRTALFLSRIHPKKGLLNLIEAWRRVRPANWRLCLAGPDDGGHLAEVMRCVRTLGVDASVEYVGEVDGDAKTALFENADLFVLPSFSENFGVVVAEALAHGLPVITTTGTPWQGLTQRNCGWWIDPTVDALTTTLRIATALERATLEAIGQRGRAYAAEFDWRHIARQTADVYRWVLKQGPRPDCVVVD